MSLHFPPCFYLLRMVLLWLMYFSWPCSVRVVILHLLMLFVCSSGVGSVMGELWLVAPSFWSPFYILCVFSSVDSPILFCWSYREGFVF